MCNCLEESTKRTGDYLKERLGDRAAKLGVCDYENKAFLFDNGKHELVLSMPFKLQYYRKKKDGNPESKLTTVNVNILPTYCPFCGIKIKDE